MAPVRQQPRETERRCDLCGRDVQLDSLHPGWVVVRVDGEPAWSCPDCSREHGVWNELGAAKPV